ncbi:unnamed protein product [Orchesella dallaii]|uniref:Uncharacterized protein n=1 Tax=Orchesella dallaii TaxID=48710 RepID=A0ABP1QYC7_9HEXA
MNPRLLFRQKNTKQRLHYISRAGSSLLQSNNAEQVNQELRLSPNYGKVRKNVNDSYHVSCLSSHSNDTFWVNPKGQRIINSHERHASKELNI